MQELSSILIVIPFAVLALLAIAGFIVFVWKIVLLIFFLVILLIIPILVLVWDNN